MKNINSREFKHIKFENHTLTCLLRLLWVKNCIDYIKRVIYKGSIIKPNVCEKLTIPKKKKKEQILSTKHFTETYDRSTKSSQRTGDDLRNTNATITNHTEPNSYNLLLNGDGIFIEVIFDFKLKHCLMIMEDWWIKKTHSRLR